MLLKNLDCLLWAVDSLNENPKGPSSDDDHSENVPCGVSMKAKRSGGGAYNKHLLSCSLFVDYIFLDRDERRYMAQNAHQYAN